MNFDEFLAMAWDDHAEHPDAVAQRLAQSLPILTAPDQVPQYARIIIHVYGEHLARWQEGIDLLESLRQVPVFDHSPALTGAVTRGAAALAVCSGSTAALDELSVEDRVTALAIASAAFVGQRAFGQAIGAYEDALALAEPGLPAGSSALRALAVGGNNIAAELEEKPDRDAAETAAMLSAAHSGLKYWQQAGTWLETERAQYRLASSLRKAGKPFPAVDSAQACIAVCAANDAPAFERFFGYAMLALAQRDAGDQAAFAVARQQAMACYDQIPEEEKKWCSADLQELGT